ncbi:MAG: S8 family serine peptidase, partial [Phycisphaerales bacterium]
MSRHFAVWSLASYLAVASGDVVRAAGPGASIPERLDARTLYLRADTFDTRALPNVLDEPHARNVTATRSFDRNKLYVIQLAGPILPEQRTALEQAGVALGDYLPQNAYIADLSGASRAALAQLGFVRFVGEYNPTWKVAPDIGQRVFATEERQALQDEGVRALTVSLFKHASLEQVTEVVELIETAVVHYSESTQTQSTVSMSIDAEHVDELAALPGVQFIEEAPEITVRNATVRWIVQSNIPDFTPLHDNGLHGEEQIVGILDNKIDVDHCSFYDTEPIGPTHRKILAYNTTLGISSHGTHVAGIVVGDAGTFNNLRGHAYLGKLVYNTIPSYNETGIVTALNLHHSQGARIHTNSWGNDGTTEYDSLARGFDVFCYENEDDLVALAVTNTLTLRNPENAKNLLAVGATADTPSQHTHCYGGTGPTSDGRRKPEIYAPGCVIQSARYNTECDA